MFAMTGARLHALRRQVERAFANRPYPGDDQIAESDPRYEDYEGHAVTRFHLGKSWKQITLRTLVDDYPCDPSACLAFMTADGWRYYLPAYLLIALDWDQADAIGDAVVGNLTHPRARAAAYAQVAANVGREPEEVLAAQTHRFDERISGLSRAEVDAVRAVLSFLAERIDAGHQELGGGLPNDARIAAESWPSA
jgi:hypothetical protein